MHNQAAGSPQKGYETSDAAGRPIAWFAVSLLVLLGVALGIAGWFYSSLEAQFQRADQRPSPLASGAQTPPEPRLQVYPRQELDAARETERLRLHEYRWIDRAQGVVQIPIERALELVAERGIEPTPSPSTDPPPQERH